MVVPFGERSSYDLRPNIAIPKPAGTTSMQPLTSMASLA